MEMIVAGSGVVSRGGPTALASGRRPPFTTRRSLVAQLSIQPLASSQFCAGTKAQWFWSLITVEYWRLRILLPLN